jgi:hypothetical protein
MRRVLWLMTMALVLSSVSAVAQRPAAAPKEFRAGEQTVQQREEARTKARYKMNTWHEADDNLPQEFQFPWMPIGFTLLCFAVVTPFAMAMYRRMSAELEATEAGSPKMRGARAKKDDAEEEQQ